MRSATRAASSFRLPALTLLLASGMAFGAEPARAQQSCSCEGAMGPQIIPNTLVVGDSVTIDLCYSNTAKVSGGIINNVEVDLTGNVYARLACSDPGCLTEGDGGNALLELAGTLTFDDCVASPLSPGAFADVASCALDTTNHPNENTVLIQLDADGLHFEDNEVLCIARIEATASEAVPTLTGSFQTRVATDPDGIVIAEPAAGTDMVTCSNNGNTCGTNGTNSASIPPRCDVEVDKQVSCDGGTTFVDVGFGDSGAESCSGWNTFDGMAAEPIQVKYVARNHPDNDLPVTNCVLTESNELIGDPNDPGFLPLGGEPFTFLDTDQACSDELAANEPNTATINCECLVEGGSIPATDSDMADFACLEPRLQVEKQCEDTDDNQADDRVSIEVMNIAGDNTANLVNCLLTDTLDKDEPSANCPGDGLELEDVPVTPSSFDLAAGGKETATGSFGDRLTASCNEASVTCEIEGSGGKTVTATDEFPCRPLTCDVRLDKVLIVDGVRIDEGDFDVRVLGQGISWAGFDGMPPDNVDFEFIIENNGTAAAECELIDVVEGGTERVNETAILVPAGGTQTVTRQSACTAEVAGTDTATLSCTCVDDVQETATDTDTDQAELLCLTPGLAVAKECVDTNPANGLDDGVSITVMNTGEADLVNCQVTDSLDKNEPDPMACPAGDDVDVESVTVAPQGFSLAAGTPGNPTEQVVTGSFPDLTAGACNDVSVTCTVDGTAKTITATNHAVCTGGVCSASFDKQVSCDGVTWVDEEIDDDPDNANVRGCIGWNAFDGMPAEPANRRFLVENTGDFPIECSIVDVNGGTENFGPFTVQPGETYTENDPGTCSPELSGTDTATLSCSCVGTQVEITQDTPFVDQAEILCRTPRLEVTKLCEEQENDRNEITITITNPAGADGATLENCVVSDPQAPECDGAPVTSPLAPGASDTVTCGIDGLSSEITNSVTVTCDVQGTSKEISETATDLCEVPEDECLTRTPGFWCTHPTVTDLFLDVNVCGLPLTNVQVATVGSAIENMNFGNDHKASTSPQLLQLVRQCTAAALNQSASLGNDGDCRSAPIGTSSFGAVFDACCSASFCTAGTSASAITASGCIEKLDQFNNSEDTFANAPPPFDNLGTAMCPIPDPYQPLLTNACSAQPARCNEANGNGFVNPPYRNSGGSGGNGPPGPSKKK